MTERPHDVSYELGGIKQALDTITRTLSENRTADAQYRTDIRREMGSQHDAIASIGTELGMAKRDIADMKPKVDSLNERATMSRGAASLAIALGKFAHVITAAIGGIIAVLVEHWFRGWK
jgi:flagellar basal body L-ring protein FlgH